MRTRATALVVAAVVVLAVAATIDALRPEGGRAPPQSARPSVTLPVDEDAVTARLLARYGVSGALYLTVRTGPGCEYRVYPLPRLGIMSSGPLSTCRFQVSPDGRQIAELHECPARQGQIWDFLNPSLGARGFVGCAAAWKPDGTVTYVSGGAVVAASIDCLGAVGCTRVVVPRSAVARAVRRFGAELGPAAVTQIEWLTASRLAVVVRINRARESILLFERRRPVQTVDLSLPPHSHLEVVPDQEEILVGGRGWGGFRAFNFNGGFVAGNRVPFGDAAAIAYSPDGRWLALARPGNVCIYPRDESDFPVGCIEGDAQDLAWR